MPGKAARASSRLAEPGSRPLSACLPASRLAAASSLPNQGALISYEVNYSNPKVILVSAQLGARHARPQDQLSTGIHNVAATTSTLMHNRQLQVLLAVASLALQYYCLCSSAGGAWCGRGHPRGARFHRAVWATHCQTAITSTDSMRHRCKLARIHMGRYKRLPGNWTGHCERGLTVCSALHSACCAAVAVLGCASMGSLRCPSRGYASDAFCTFQVFMSVQEHGPRCVTGGLADALLFYALLDALPVCFALP